MKRMIWASALCLSLLGQPALAQPVIELEVSKSTSLMLPGITQVSVTDPAIADVQVTRERDLLINGKRPGTTTLVVWTRNGSYSFDLRVGLDLASLRTVLYRALGTNSIKVDSLNNRVILSGTVPKASQVEMAGKVAEAYTKNVVNLLAVQALPQVQVDVQVVELRRGRGHELGVDWGSLRVLSNGDAIFSKGLHTFAQGPVGTPFTFGQFDRLAAQLQLLVTEGQAKILARPKLVAASGGKASFLVGGQIPIPEAQQLGQVTVSWRDYGIKLNVEPTVREDGRVALRVRPEVSALDFNNAIRLNGFTIPSISSRQAETEVILRPGEGLAIGGLMQTTETRSVEKFPLLGDIPILGELFKSRQFQTEETELAIFVSPQLVTPSATDSLSPGGLP